MDSDPSSSSPIPNNSAGNTNTLNIGAGAHVGQIAVGENIKQTYIERVVNNLFTSDDAARERRNQLILLDKVKTFWVKGVLENSVYHAALIELGKETQPEAVEHPWDMVVQTPNQQNQQIPRGKKIIEIFQVTNRALLILGAPGSGKTITLLELARDAIAHAESDISAPIPVIFNLSSWRDNSKFAEWLAEELAGKYQIPKKIGRMWVEQEDLMLLLDGLDEVRVQDRNECVQAINAFRLEHGVASIAVCSRIQEYRDLDTKLNLGGAILLEPLTPAQIDAYLITSGGLNLRTALRADTVLQELAQSPLMLNVMTLAYQDAPAQEIEHQETRSIEARRKQLFELYRAGMFKRKGIHSLYSPEQTILWLSWLARKMISSNQSQFLIEQLQPSWLSSRKQLWAYAHLSRLIGGLIFGLIAGLFLSFISQLIGRSAGLTEYLIFGFTIGLMVGLVDRIQFERQAAGIKSNGAVVYQTLLTNGLVYGLGFALCGALSFGSSFSVHFDKGEVQSVDLGVGILIGGGFGLACGVLYGLIVVLRDATRSITNDIQRTESLTLSIAGIRKGVFFGVGAGLLAGLITGLISNLIFNWAEGLVIATFFVALSGSIIGALFGGLKRSVVDIKVTPNQGIKLSIRNAVIAGLFSGIFSALVFGLAYTPGHVLDSGLGAGWTLDLGDGLVPRLTVALRDGLVPGLMLALRDGLTLGLIFGLLSATSWYSGIDVIRHYTLRFTLYVTRQFPWEITRFLDYAASLIFLQKVGGGYIFIHRLLLEHFATMDNAQQVTKK